VGADSAHSWPVVSNLALVPALTSEQVNLLPREQESEQQEVLTREQQVPLTSERAPLLTSKREVEWNQPDELLTSEQLEEAAEWLKSLLPKPSSGWWDVAANGKGFVIKQRWRVSGKQETQTYPRVSREQFLTLKGMSDEHAKDVITDTIAGHLDDIIAGADRTKRDKARRAAAKLEIAD
jgi:hypothetical protein